ncbi:AAA family ATPase [Staphylococcus chromogenes]|uniref:McrB family protein n=1 Tax=Staphylococcus chromogenes TaxID=46126 RepID=UPI000CD0457D|nr:AAA family ATPase [Staphylococcus chromogenes]MBP0046433.1 AAA family ATPase [Staphylococcus chromogenes]PNY90311.1 hypothetical protein CD151_11105 [Staphylococcus chromogenes]GGI32712.1 hypothetical protein GCM10008139_15730 [Staphylococcus chromogenes]SUM11435.1 putative restriction enzyme [Staphylococcus chromogenes]
MEKSNFEKWLKAQNNEEFHLIVQKILHLNRLYNDKYKKNVDFFLNPETFLITFKNFELINMISNEINYDLSTEEKFNESKAALKMDFETLVAAQMYMNFLFESDLIGSSDELSKNSLKEYENIDNRVTGGINKIYYGAPGTGKSYLVDNSYSNYDRVTFHPEYTYQDFVGSIRPLQTDDGSIKYEFVPGTFTELLIKAIINPQKKFGLIIEEINRANTAAVFGDLFQLLDRDSDGNSNYKIKNKEISEYFKKVTGMNIANIFIPSNFDIIATMNSSDQGVFVMDSAFKRRWEFEYIPIDYDVLTLKNVKIAGLDLGWISFIKALNEFLAINGVEEDKLIGPWFMSINNLNDKNQVASKLLIYLWDDVLRYERSLLFAETSFFSQVIYLYKNQGLNCFNKEFQNFINEYYPEDV